MKASQAWGRALLAASAAWLAGATCPYEGCTLDGSFTCLESWECKALDGGSAPGYGCCVNPAPIESAAPCLPGTAACAGGCCEAASAAPGSAASFDVVYNEPPSDADWVLPVVILTVGVTAGVAACAAWVACSFEGEQRWAGEEPGEQRGLAADLEPGEYYLAEEGARDAPRDEKPDGSSSGSSAGGGKPLPHISQPSSTASTAATPTPPQQSLAHSPFAIRQPLLRVSPLECRPDSFSDTPKTA
ncbi:hypothetical protein DIPPA_19941 [Diplonema papillatum]|nr:hypothetical protein DIPPA_19941 [Diplonema papillatum]